VSDYRATDDRDPTGMSGPHRWCVKYRVESRRVLKVKTVIIPARWESDIRAAFELAYGDEAKLVCKRVWWDATKGRGNDGN